MSSYQNDRLKRAELMSEQKTTLAYSLYAKKCQHEIFFPSESPNFGEKFRFGLQPNFPRNRLKYHKKS